MENVGFTGHRVIDSETEQLLKVKLLKTIKSCIDDGAIHFYAGGALGFDTLAASAVLALKENHPFIQLHLLLPFPQQHKNWKREAKELFGEILSKADSVEYAYERYLPGVYHLRDRYIVEHADVMIAYMNQPQGGTAYTVNLANQYNKKIINLAYTT